MFELNFHPLDSVAGTIHEFSEKVWQQLVHFLTIENDIISVVSQGAIYATLIASVIIILTMLYVRPRKHLDRAFLLRELGLTTVISAIFARRFLDFFSPIWYLLGFIILFLSAIYIVYSIFVEYTRTEEEIVTQHAKEYKQRNV